jgi:hypothetical protein
MTEVRPCALPLPGGSAFERLDCPLQRHDLAGQQVLADEVLMRFAPRRLEQIHHGYWHFTPSQQTASFQTALAGDQAAFRRHDDRVQ